MNLFAQIENVPSEWLKNFALVIAAILASAFYAKGIFTNKQKREVSFTETPASKREFEAHALECKSDRALLWSELNKDRHDNQVHASDRSKTLFSKIESVRTELTESQSELRAEMQRNFQDTERALGRIEGKLDERQN